MNPCKTCPFLENTKNFGAPDWLMDVGNLVEDKSISHSCHCTDHNADGYIGGHTRQCDGIKMVRANSESGFKVYPEAFRNWTQFFVRHARALKFEGLIK